MAKARTAKQKAASRRNGKKNKGTGAGVGMSTQAGWTPPGLSRTLSPDAIKAIKKDIAGKKVKAGTPATSFLRYENNTRPNGPIRMSGT